MHAAALSIGAGVGDDGFRKIAEADVGVLPLIDPADLHAIVGGGLEGVLQGLVVEVVGSHVQGVLGGCDPCSHRIVHVHAERLGLLYGGDRVVHRAVEVDMDGARRVRYGSVRANGGGGTFSVRQARDGPGEVDLTGFEPREVHAVVGGTRGTRDRHAEGFGQSIFHHTIGVEVGAPGKGKTGGRHVGLDHGRGVADARCRKQIDRTTRQELVSSRTVKGELAHDANEVNGASREGFPHQAVAGADVHDARLAVCGEVVGVVACDFKPSQRERRSVDPHELPLKRFVHVGSADDQGLRQGAGAFEHDCGQVRSDLQQAVVLGDFTGHGQRIPDCRGRVPIPPIPTGIERDAGGGILQVADRAEIVVAGHHSGDRHNVANAIVGAGVEDVVLGLEAAGQGQCHQGTGKNKLVHGRFWSPLSSSTALRRIMRGGPTKISACPLPPSGP